jgi:hypothetical protein
VIEIRQFPAQKQSGHTKKHIKRRLQLKDSQDILRNISREDSSSIWCRGDLRSLSLRGKVNILQVSSLKKVGLYYRIFSKVRVNSIMFTEITAIQSQSLADWHHGSAPKSPCIYFEKQEKENRTYKSYVSQDSQGKKQGQHDDCTGCIKEKRLTNGCQQQLQKVLSCAP